MHQYRRRICVLLGILFYLATVVPGMTADEAGIPSLPKGVRFDQTMNLTPRRGPLLWSYGESKFSAAVNATEKQNRGGYRWEGPPAESPDWLGIKRDTIYFLSYQFVAIAILYVAPEKLSGWTQEDKDNWSINKWKENVKHPIWDEDEWWVNYILHPYWGATYYTRAQERGFKRMQSFWYSVLLSTLYEYGAEALFEPVSIQDLIVTPVAGSLLGEYLFNPIRKRIRAKEQLHWSDKAVLLITDPLGVINEELNRIFGINTEVSFRQLRMETIPPSPGLSDERENKEESRPHINPVWGLQLKINW
jgi:hypothetical protein